MAFCAPQNARADEFSTLPPNDPIVIQLAQISLGPAPASLTRYEAALQTARVILDVQGREPATVSRAQWRAIATLSQALKSELRQLGVDVEAARALASRALATQSAKTASSAAPPTASQNATGLWAPLRAATKTSAARNSSFLAPELVSRASVGANTSDNVSKSALELRLAPGLRLATGMPSALRSQGVSPTGASRFAPRPASTQGAPGALASQTAISYDLGRYLTLRAANSRLDWSAVPSGADESPLLGAPLFANASGASGTGGGVDLNVGSGLKFSTEIERLRANTGALASRIGGGASLSAFQDRLSLNMSLSRLLPEDKTALVTTAAEVGASLDVSPRLSLNLRYQGLFAPTPSISASRVGGGVSLSF